MGPVMQRADETRLRMPHDARWWLLPLAAYLVARVASAAMMVLASRGQVYPAGWPSAGAVDGGTGYLSVVANWDGRWYAEIAQNGYPASLPVDASGQVAQNAWVFFPLFPLVVRVLVLVTGMSFPLAATLLTTVAGGVGMLLVYRVVRLTAERFAALATVVVLSFSMASPVFQIAYTESFSLVLLAGTLLAVIRGRYAVAAGLVLLLSFTRPITPPLALAIGIWALVMRRRGDRDWRRAAVLAVWAAVSSLWWPLVTALVTGRPRAYFESQAAWDNRPLASLTDLLRWTGRWEMVVLALSLATVVLAALPATGGRWHPVLRWWMVVYPVYLLSAHPPTSSGLRYLLLAFAVFWPFSGPGVSRVLAFHRRAPAVLLGLVVVGCVAAQWYWVSRGLVVGPGWRFTP